jgi:ribosomal protein S27AE
MLPSHYRVNLTRRIIVDMFENKKICPKCNVTLEKQLLRSMDGTKPFETQGTNPPPMLDAVPVFPYKCPKCGYTEYEQLRERL